MAIISITSAALDSGDPTTAVAGEALTAGEFIYFASDSKVYKADNSTTTLADVVGIMLNDCAADLVAIYATNGQTVTTSSLGSAGKVLCASSTAGDCEELTDIGVGEAITIVGVSASATSLQLEISPTSIVQVA